MLRFLRINASPSSTRSRSNSAPGLNVLTGETGAGKSILVEAVGLLLGGRASGDLVRTGEEAATIEAIFERDGEEMLVRREITAQGRSRAFVNGALATAGRAQGAVASQLIELHGQHEHQTLLDPGDPSRRVVDEFGAHDQLRRRGAGGLRAGARRPRRARPPAQPRGRPRRAAGARARFSSPSSSGPASTGPGEDDELAALRQVLASAERVERLCPESYAALYEQRRGGAGGARRRLAARRRAGGARPAVSAVPRGAGRHQVAARGSRALPAALRRRHRSLAGAAAAGRGAARAARASQAEVRSDAGGRDRPAGPPRRARSPISTTGTDGMAAPRARPGGGVATRYLEAARTLSAARRRVGRGVFVGARSALLAELAMERTRFEVRFADPADRTSRGGRATGLDTAEFFVSPNPGEDLRPLARIVSGGELSRVMLAIKTLTATGRRGFSQDGWPRAERGSAGPDLRRGRRRHRRTGGRRGRRQAAGAGLGVPGAVHHAPAADRGLRRRALPDREARRRRAYPDDGRPPRRRGAGGRDCPYAGRSPRDRRRPGVRQASSLAQERRKAKAKGRKSPARRGRPAR